MPKPCEISGADTVFLPVSLNPRDMDRFEAEVRHHLESGARLLLLDCSQLEQLYSGHVRLMWTARDACVSRGATLRLISVLPDVIRILKLLDLLEFFPFRVSDEEQGYADAVGTAAESVRQALDGFDDFLHRIRAPESVKTDARTIFYEVTNNILSHGRLDPTEVVIVTAILTTTDTHRELIMRFTDNGIPFDSARPQPRLVPQDAAAEGRTRGFGLMMVNRLSDDLSYERYRSTFNVITARKRWSI